MGWCSATEILDAAIGGADAVVSAVLEAVGMRRESLEADNALNLDAVLQPFVVLIAEKLRTDDWDCPYDSVHFWRFPQELLGYDDRKYEEFLRARLQDATKDSRQRAHIARLLVDVNERMAEDGR